MSGISLNLYRHFLVSLYRHLQTKSGDLEKFRDCTCFMRWIPAQSARMTVLGEDFEDDGTGVKK